MYRLYFCSFINIHMPIILIVEKTGTVKPLTLKEYKEDDLYKKAGFKSADGFTSHCSWTSSTTTANVSVDTKGTNITSMTTTSSNTTATEYMVTVYGKTTGRAGQENKYDFPPPIDNTLFFGACVLVAKNEIGTCIDLPVSTWTEMYEQLFGGFEDIGSEDTETDEDDDEDAGLPRTKEGYAKDGFIVDDDVEEEAVEDKSSESEFNDDEDDSEYSDEKPKKRKLKKPIKKAVAKKTATKATKSTKKNAQSQLTMQENVFVTTEDENVSEFLDCTSELSEEEYFA